jgi:hypothetical protein
VALDLGRLGPVQAITASPAWATKRLAPVPVAFADFTRLPTFASQVRDARPMGAAGRSRGHTSGRHHTRAHNDAGTFPTLSGQGIPTFALRAASGRDTYLPSSVFSVYMGRYHPIRGKPQTEISKDSAVNGQHLLYKDVTFPKEASPKTNLTGYG